MSPARINDDPLIVVVRREGAADLGPFDFDVPGVPLGVKKALKAAFEAKVRTGGGWAAPKTIRWGFHAAVTFAQDISVANPRLGEIGDVTAGILDAWSHSGHSGFPPPNSDINAVRTLLKAAGGLPEPTLAYLVRRRPPRTLQPHTLEEQELLVDVAWEVTGGTFRRIRDNLQVRDRYRSGEEPAETPWGTFRDYGRCTAGELLHYVSINGDTPGWAHTDAKELKDFLQIPVRRFKDALFLSRAEVFALQVLFVAEGGYSPESLGDLEAVDPGISEDAIAAHVTEDGGRAGCPGCSDGGVPEARAHLHAIAAFLTQPAREAWATLGHPTKLLFVCGVQRGRSSDPATRFAVGKSLRNHTPRDWARRSGVQQAAGVRWPHLQRLRPATSPGDTHGNEVIGPPVSGANGGGHGNFSDLRNAPAWVESIIAAFQRLTGPGGKWRSREAARAGAGVLRRIAREMAAAHPHAEVIDDITTVMHGEWCARAISGADGRRDSADIAHALFREVWSWARAGDAAPSAGGGRTASLPEPGWDPDQQGAGGELTVIATSAGGVLIDFRAFDVPRGLLVPFVDLFRKETVLGGRWRSRATVKGYASEAKRFLREISVANPDLSEIEDLTPEMWWAWTQPEQGGGPPGNTVKRAMRLLQDIEGLPETTRQAVRRHHVPRKKSRERGYSVSEARAFWGALQEMMDEAVRRIGPNREKHARYLSGQEPPDSPKYWISGEWWTEGSYLDHVFRHSRAPSKMGPATRTRLRAALGIASGAPPTSALFPTTTEMFSLMLMFVYEGGENLSVLGGMEPGGFRADDFESDPPILMVEYDKPRRGARRFSWETIIGRQASIREVAELLTETAREACAEIGHPTSLLFTTSSVPKRSTDPAHWFITDWSGISGYAGPAWSKLTGVTDDGGKHPTLRRMRRTRAVMSEVPRQNTLQTHWTEYRRDDPKTLEIAVAVLPNVQARIIADAKTYERQLRILRTTEASAAPEELARALGVKQERVQPLLDGDHDTALVACPDMYQSPFGEPGQPCPVVSYRSCFGCPCAIMTERHLPGVATYRDELITATRHLTEEEWQEGYAQTFEQVEDALSQWTPEEVDAARGASTAAHVIAARALLDSDSGA